MNEKTGTEKKNYGGWAFIPLVVFLVIYLDGGMFFQLEEWPVHLISFQDMQHC